LNHKEKFKDLHEINRHKNTKDKGHPVTIYKSKEMYLKPEYFHKAGDTTHKKPNHC